jgi:hypothetical protein
MPINAQSNSSRHLKPGGYVEFQDVYFPSVCNDPAKTDESIFIKYNHDLIEGTRRVGLDFQATLKWKEQLEAAGFVDVHSRWVNWPVGPWAKHRKNKIIGKFTHADFTSGLDMTRPIFQGVLGKSKEEVDSLFADVRKELDEQKIHLFQKVCFCYGRKPEAAAEETAIGGAKETETATETKDA